MTNYSDSVTFRVRLYNNATQEAIENQIINFYLIVDESQQFIGQRKTNDKGEAYYTIESVTYSPGDYGIKAMANVSGEVVMDQTDFIVNKENTKISIIGGTNVEYSDSTQIMVRLSTDDGENIPDRSLRMYIYSQMDTIDAGSAITNTDGLAVFNVSTTGGDYLELKAGIYDCLVVFEGDNYYLQSSYKFDLNVSKEELEIYMSTIGKKVVGSAIVIFVRVEDNDGASVASAEVTIFINDELVAIGRTDKDGTYEFSWTPEEPGNYTIKIYVSKGENYLSKESIIPLYIEGEKEGNSIPVFLIAVLLFLIVAVVVAFISRK